MNTMMRMLISICVILLTFACGKTLEFPTPGLQGPAGPQGAPGVAGAPGSSCSVTAIGATLATPNGASLITCSDGSQSLVLNGTPGSQGIAGQNGQNGHDGHDGSQGSQGAQGTAGTPGTVITSVKFCSGSDSYPSTFAEVGFCISGKLYAVYSDHGGFLTEVVPGSYSSNGINSSCTFTVYTSCTVVHN